MGAAEVMTYWDGSWRRGAFPMAGPMSHGLVFGSSVFDGARWIDGAMPDLDRHCARINRSVTSLGLDPLFDESAIAALAREGVTKFSGKRALYIRPTYWAEASGDMGVDPDPASTSFCLTIYEADLPATGSSLGLVPTRRPGPETMPTDAKGGCLYPTSARAVREAQSRGFGNALMCDTIGNIAETATTNIFMAKGGKLFTPVPNGSFLNGITRQRVIALMRDKGVEVIEKSLRIEDFLDADEVFTTGNFAKILPITRIEGRSFDSGQFVDMARTAYFAWVRAAE